MDMHTPAPTEELGEAEQHARTPSDRRRDRCARHTELGERTEPEDERRPERDVDCVREPERAHRELCVACTAEDAVDQEQQKDRCVPAQHHARERAAAGNDFRRCAHQLEQRRCEHRAADA